MKNETPRRKRLQIHLSTAVVLMIAAGALIWANLTPRKEIIDPFVATYYGWPLTAAGSAEPLHESTAHILVLHDPNNAFMIYWRVAVDFCFALLLLALIWCFCEWLIGRRAPRKGT